MGTASVAARCAEDPRGGGDITETSSFRTAPVSPKPARRRSRRRARARRRAGRDREGARRATTRRRIRRRRRTSSICHDSRANGQRRHRGGIPRCRHRLLLRARPQTRRAGHDGRRVGRAQETSNAADAFQRVFPSARIVRLPPGSDHYVWETNETEVLREMRAFIGGLTRTPRREFRR